MNNCVMVNTPSRPSLRRIHLVVVLLDDRYFNCTQFQIVFIDQPVMVIYAICNNLFVPFYASCFHLHDVWQDLACLLLIS